MQSDKTFDRTSAASEEQFKLSGAGTYGQGDHATSMSGLGSSDQHRNELWQRDSDRSGEQEFQREHRSVRSVLVIGANGYLGERLIKVLHHRMRSDNFKLFALSRNDDYEFLRKHNVEIRRGDLSKFDSLRGEPLRGIDIVISALGAYGRDYELFENLVKAAKESRVQRFVLLSALNADEAGDDVPHFENLHKIERMLQQGSMEWVSVRAAPFLDYPYGIDEERKVEKGSWYSLFDKDVKSSWVWSEDVARALADAALSLPSSATGKRIPITAQPAVDARSLSNTLDSLVGEDVDAKGSGLGFMEKIKAFFGGKTAQKKDFITWVNKRGQYQPSHEDLQLQRQYFGEPRTIEQSLAFWLMSEDMLGRERSSKWRSMFDSRPWSFFERSRSENEGERRERTIDGAESKRPFDSSFEQQHQSFVKENRPVHRTDSFSKGKDEHAKIGDAGIAAAFTGAPLAQDARQAASSSPQDPGVFRDSTVIPDPKHSSSSSSSMLRSGELRDDAQTRLGLSGQDDSNNGVLSSSSDIKRQDAALGNLNEQRDSNRRDYSFPQQQDKETAFKQAPVHMRKQEDGVSQQAPLSIPHDLQQQQQHQHLETPHDGIKYDAKDEMPRDQQFADRNMRGDGSYPENTAVFQDSDRLRQDAGSMAQHPQGFASMSDQKPASSSTDYSSGAGFSSVPSQQVQPTHSSGFSSGQDKENRFEPSHEPKDINEKRSADLNRADPSQLSKLQQAHRAGYQQPAAVKSSEEQSRRL